MNLLQKITFPSITRKTVIIACLVFIFFVIATGIYGISLLRVVNIQVISPDHYLVGVEKNAGKNLLLLNSEEMVKELLQSNKKVSEIQIQKKYPQTLQIQVLLKKPVIVIDTNTSPLYVSADGVVLSRVDKLEKDDLIHITDLQFQYSVGEKIPSEVVNIVVLSQELRDRLIQIKEITIDRKMQTSTIELENGTEVILLLFNTHDTIAASLQTILDRFRIEGKTIAKIDFRFEKPIVSLRSGQKNSP